MRLPLTLAIAAALALTACGHQADTAAQASQQAAARPAGPPPVAADAIAVRGSVSIDGLNGLPSKLLAQLQLRLRLLDMTDPSIVPPVVAERLEPAPAHLPYSYALPYAAESIKADGRYVFEAALVTGKDVLYGTPTPVAVLTQGAGGQADIALVRGGGLPAPNIAPSDLLQQDFEKLERSIGGMKKFSGESIDETTTRAWDAFKDSQGIRFARQVVDYEKGGVVSFKFAYKGGQPWAIAKEKNGVVTHLGWGADGAVLLNRDSNDRQLDEAGIAELKALAETLYQEASAKAGG